MILKTERLILRPWEESDAESLYEFASNPEVGPIAGWPVHTSIENSLETIKGVLSVPETYAVCLKEDNKAIGSIGLLIGIASNIGIPDTEGEIGYWIGVPFWGKGLIPEAAREIIRYAFEDLHIEKLWCGYFGGNIKSKRVQEKCGFTYHHTEENKPWPLMGDVRTEHITCLTKEQWESGIIIRSLSEKEKASACDLAWQVFLKYEAPEYSQEGIDEFRSTLDDPAYNKKARFYGAFSNNQLVGVLAMRSPQHITLFFVDEAFHNKGIGRKLFARMKQDYEKQEFTVNSSPYAVKIYEHLGFISTEREQLTNGIRYTPMIYKE